MSTDGGRGHERRVSSSSLSVQRASGRSGPGDRAGGVTKMLRRGGGQCANVRTEQFAESVLKYM